MKILLTLSVQLSVYKKSWIFINGYKFLCYICNMIKIENYIPFDKYDPYEFILNHQKIITVQKSLSFIFSFFTEGSSYNNLINKYISLIFGCMLRFRAKIN